MGKKTKEYSLQKGTKMRDYFKAQNNNNEANEVFKTRNTDQLHLVLLPY